MRASKQRREEEASREIKCSGRIVTLYVRCSFCNAQATYDGKTQRGPWAYMCDDCIKIHGYPRSLMNTKLVPPKKKEGRL